MPQISKVIFLNFIGAQKDIMATPVKTALWDTTEVRRVHWVRSALPATATATLPTATP